MKDRRPEELLWELPRVAGTDDGPAPSDVELAAYRAGRLAAAEVERLEWMLTRSASGRARLAALGGVSLAPVPDRLRSRILGDPRALLSARRLDWHWAAAAVLVVAIGAATLLLLQRETRPGRTLPEFTVRVEGLAETRSDGGAARALPESAVRIVIEAEGPAVPGVAYAVYRMDENRLERLDESRVGIEAHRAGAVLRTTGESLAGSEAGPHDFYVAVAPASRLPERLEVGRGRDPAAALALATGGRVYRRTLTIETSENER